MKRYNSFFFNFTSCIMGNNKLIYQKSFAMRAHILATFPDSVTRAILSGTTGALFINPGTNLFGNLPQDEQLEFGVGIIKMLAPALLPLLKCVSWIGELSLSGWVLERQLGLVRDRDGIISPGNDRDKAGILTCCDKELACVENSLSFADFLRISQQFSAEKLRKNDLCNRVAKTPVNVTSGMGYLRLSTSAVLDCQNFSCCCRELYRDSWKINGHKATWIRWM